MLMLVSLIGTFSVNAEIDTSRGRNIKINMIKDTTYVEQECEVSGNSLIINGGKYANFSVNAPATGIYNVKLHGVYVGGATWFRFYNSDTNTQMSAGVLPETHGDTTTWMPNYPTTTESQITIKLNKGINNLKLTAGNRSSLTNITFSFVELNETEIKYTDFDYIDGNKVSADVLTDWTSKGYDQQWNYPVMTSGRKLGIDVDFLVSGEYKVTLNAGRHPSILPNFVLTNETTNSKITKETEIVSGTNLYDIHSYDMGTMNIKAGDKLTLENIASGGNTCFKSLTFTWVGEYKVSDTMYVDVNTTLTDDNKYITFDLNAPIKGTYNVTVNQASTYNNGGDWLRFYKIGDDGSEIQIAANIINATSEEVTRWYDANNNYSDIKVTLDKGINKMKMTIGNYLKLKGVTFKYDDSNLTVGFADFDYIDSELSSDVTTDYSTKYSLYYNYPWMASGRSLSLIFNQTLTGGTYRVKLNGYTICDNSASDDYSKESKLIFTNEMTGEKYDVSLPSVKDGGTRQMQSVLIGTLELNHGDILTVKSIDKYSAFSGLTFEKVETIKINGKVGGILKSGDNAISIPKNYIKDATSNIAVYGAVYENGKLVDIDIADYSTISDTPLTLTAPNDLTNVTYKIFFWDKTTLSPVGDVFPATDTTTNTIYVSKNGLDMNNGNEATPVASLQRAKELANEKKSSIDDDITVIIGKGEYTLESELLFLSTDSGYNNHKIIYQGDENGETVINGGVKLANWNETSNGSSLYVSKNDKLTDKIRHLTVNDETVSMSRSEKLTKGDLRVDGENLIVKNTAFKKENLEQLKNEKNAEMYAVIGFSDLRIPISEFKVGDSETTIVFDSVSTEIHNTTKTVTNDDGTTSNVEYTVADIFYNSLSEHNSNYFGGLYVENALLFTDSENEFYSDKTNNEIYYYTSGNINEKAVYAPISEGLFNFNGVKNVVVKNITFENGTWNSPSIYGLKTRQAEKYDLKKNEYSERGGELIRGQITFNDCDNVSFENNTVKNVGSTAVALRNNNKNCNITGNTVKNTAGGAISIGQPIDRPKNTENILVKNNDIDNIGLQYRSCPAITVYFAKNVDILHNDINNVAYTGISLGLSWSEYVSDVGDYEVAYNKISNVMTETDDGSHIYTNGPSILGTTIHDNYLVKGNGWPNGQNSSDRGGIYFDNGSCNVEAYNNVIEECGAWLFAVDTKLGTYCPTNAKDCTNKDNCNRDCQKSPLSVYNNYTDSTICVNKASNVTVLNTNSNTTNEAVDIKNTAGVEK